jgi:hypothetical protein
MLKNIYNDNLTFWDFFTNALNIFKENFKIILLITLIIYIPINIFIFYLWELLINSPEVTFEEFSNYIKIIWWLENIIWVIASIFIILLVKQYIDWEKIEFNILFKKSLNKWSNAVWANILYSIWVWLLLLLLIVPWIIFAVYWIFFIYALVLRDISPTKTFDYSKNLVKWRWFEIFWYGAFSFFSLFFLSLLLWFIPYIENIFVDISTNLILDLFHLFIVIIFTLKFLNIDKNETIDIEEIESHNKENVEL